MTAGGETHEAAAWSAAIFARRFDVHPARVAGRPDCNLHEPDPPAASRYDDRRCGASERGAVSQEVARARAGDAQSWSCWTRRPASRSQSCGLELSGQTVIEPFISRASQAARGSWWRQGGHHRAPVPDTYSLLPAAGNEGLRRSLHEQAQHSRADCASNSLEREAMPTERGGAPRITGNLPPQRSGCMRQSQAGLSADV